MADGCPLGCDCVETPHHYLQCTRQPGYAQIIRETQSLDIALHQTGTHPDLHKILIRAVRSFLTGEIPTLRWTREGTIPTLIREAFDEQSAIGWKHLFLGRLSLKWKLAQHRHYLQQDATSTDAPPRPKSQTAQSWATNLCKRLMHVALNRWQIRNEVFHDRASAHKYEKERQQLTDAVTKSYTETKPDHPALNRLMGVSLEDLTSGPTSHMKTWQKSYDLVRHFLQPALITNFLTH